RQVTVSLVSGFAVELGEPPASDADFVRISDYWADRISRVLPDQPDLVVLPELFDRPKVSAYPSAQYLSGADRDEFARNKGNRVRDVLAEIAVANNTYITYPSYRVTGGGSVHNSMEFIGR